MAAVLIILDSLEFLDEVRFELRAASGTEFEGEVPVGLGSAAIESGPGLDTEGVGVTPTNVTPAANSSESPVSTDVCAVMLHKRSFLTRFPQMAPGTRLLVLPPYS
jgi:hypothetical protein